MKYKLLVLDVDGTLLNDAKEISKRTLAALLKGFGHDYKPVLWMHKAK